VRAVKWGIAIGLALIANAAGAQPCNRPDLADTLPPDGAAGVPLNASLFARYVTSAEYLGEEIELERVATGEIQRFDRSGDAPAPSWVAVEGMLGITPAEPLEPDERYIVRWPKLRGIATATLGLGKEIEFRTGSQLDQELPSFAGLAGADWDVLRERDRCTDSKEERYTFDLELGSASDDGGRESLALLLFQTRGPRLPVGSPEPILVRRLPEPGASVRVTTTIGDGVGETCFAAVVRDLTGKVSGGGNRESCVETVEPPFFRGCSASPAGGAAGALLLLLALAVFGRRRRLVLAIAASSSTAFAQAPAIAVFDAHASGVDPSAAAFVTHHLREAARAQGYSPLPAEATRALLAGSASFGALSPGRALELTRASGARFGVFAQVASSGGRYQVSLSVVTADGSEPRFVRGEATQQDLGTVAGGLLRSSLPPPVSPAPPPAPAPRPPAFEPRFRLALQTEAAFGVATGSFYNHLAGARLDRRFSEEFAFGAYLGYANLKGKDGRAHNVLPYFMLEYRIELEGDFALPFRFAPGYLPMNGPTARFSAGVSFSPAEDFEILLEPLIPMLWITGDQPVLSLNLAAEVAFGI
jgi:MYXO-CTERM domain-containing protein